MPDLFVVISGAPGSGKSTLAAPLAAALDLPLIAKDTIKEALGDSLGARDVDESKRLGAATMRVIFALARDNKAAVLEGTWIASHAGPELLALPAPVVEVYCDVAQEVALTRNRARAGTRHPVHFDLVRMAEEPPGHWSTPLACGWPVITVDTSKPVDLAKLAENIVQAV